MRLASKCVLLYAGCVALPLAVLSWLAYESSRDVVDHMVRANLSSSVSEAMGRFTERLAGANADLDAWSHLEEMQDVLIGDVTGDLQRELERLQRDTPLMLELAVFDREARPVARTGDAGDVDALFDGVLRAALAGSPADGDVQAIPDGRRLVVMARPIVADYDDSMVAGALVGVIDWRVVQRQLGALPLLGVTQDAGHRFVLVSRATGEVEFDSAPEAPLPVVLPGEAGYEELDVAGERFVVATAMPPASAAAGRSPWILHAMLSTRAVHGPMATLRDHFIVLGVGALLLSLVAVLMASRALLRPVLALVHASDRVAANDFDAPLPAAGSDEIGTLTRRFGHMRDAVARHQRALTAEVQERRTAEERMRAAHAEALEASRAKSRFLAAMSHEIRTPINGVMGMADLLLKSDLRPRERRFAENIERSGQVLLGVVNDILDLSRIEAGRFQLDDAPFDLRATLEDCVEMFAEAAARKRVELGCVVAPSLPAVVRGDALRLRQVLTNLLGNAVKFTEQGEVSVRVQALESSDDDVLLRFEVRDTGIGIEPAALDHIFEAFRQADQSTTRRYGGTGLGLSIARHLVGLMDGEIGAESEPGHGSLFWFTARLPRAEQSPVLPGETPLAGMRVLVIDDNATNREVLAHQLTELGAEHATAASGAEGLETLVLASRRGDPFDAAVVDQQMPGMSGMELAAALRAEPEVAGLPMLLLSSLGGAEEVAGWREAGFAAYLSKPVRRADLGQGLQSLRRDAGAAADAAPAAERCVPDGTRVLLAEDHPVNREVEVAMLRLLGCEVSVAENGAEALDLLDAERFDLVLMDCDMPVMDGFEATAALRRRERATGAARTTVIALTANALAGDRERCIEGGMDDYLSKPVVTDTLRAMLLRWLPATAAAEVAAPAAAETPALDPQVIATILAIRDDDPRGFLQELAARYQRTCEQDLAALRAAVDAGDHDQARRLAHRLKSSSSSLGATTLAACCQRIENAAREGTLPVGGSVVEELAREHARVTAALMEECRRVA